MLISTCLSARRSAAISRFAGIRRAILDAALERRGAIIRSASSIIADHVEPLDLELDPPGLDLRHVEDVVDDVEQILAARVDVAGIFDIFRRRRCGPNICCSITSAEADDGVERRPQLVAHIGEELRLRPVGRFGPRLLARIFLGEIGEPLRLLLGAAAIFCRSRTVIISSRSEWSSRSSCCLSGVMSVPTETKPPSLVRRSLICSQRPSLKLHLEGTALAGLARRASGMRWRTAGSLAVAATTS